MHVQGIKQSVCPSVVVVVVVGTKITKSQVLGICACCKHNQSVDIGEKLVCMCFEILIKAYYSATNCAFSVQHAYTHSHSIIATAHAQARCCMERVVTST